MSEQRIVPRVVLRIPGDWSHPREIVERLPAGYRLEPETLSLPDGTPVEFIPMPPDGQFPEIFRSSCRRPATDAELAILDRYTVNIGLTGAGGSVAAALAMMQAAAAFVQAGAAGVFIDNSALAHGGADWTAMTDDGGTDAVSFAFVSIIESRSEVYTMGMHVLGQPDLLLRVSDIDQEGDMLVDTIRYLCDVDRPFDVGHILADEHGPQFQVVARQDDEFEDEHPMHNPYGRLKLMSVGDIAQDN